MPPVARRPLITARLTLRPVTPLDRADLMALEADPEVMRFLNGGQPVPEQGIANGDFLTPRGEEPEVMAACERATGEFVGWFGLFDDGLLNGLKTAELGYRLRQSAWGKGYATEGARALVAEAFGPLAFDCVRAQTMTVNLGSRRVLEKAGFHPVGAVYPAFLQNFPGAEQGEWVYQIQRLPTPRQTTLASDGTVG